MTYLCRIQVFFRAMLGCVSELQASLGVISELSPVWILAAARRFDPRLDTLQHIFLLQPQLVTDITQQSSQKEPKEMVRPSLFDNIITKVKLQLQSLLTLLHFIHNISLVLSSAFNDACSNYNNS